MGYYDLPAMIDYILRQTDQSQLFYIGFSQGTTQFWILMSLKPRYNSKIKLMSALAPVAYMGNIGGILKPLSFFGNMFKVKIKRTALSNAPNARIYMQNIFQSINLTCTHIKSK